MKIIKGKFLKIFMSFLLVVPLFTVNTVNAEDNKKVFELSMPETVEKGEEIKVSLKINPKDDLSSFVLELTYDTNVFKYLSYEENDNLLDSNLDSLEVNEPLSGIVKIAYARAGILPDGENNFVEFSFQVLKDSQESGYHDIDLNVIEAINFDTEDLPFFDEVKNSTTFISVPLESLTFENESISILKGNTQQLTVIKNPTNTTVEGNPTWESSNTNIVTVDDTGTIKAVGGGSATITATLDGKEAKVNVTVKVPLTNIELNGKAYMNVNTTQKLDVVLNPEDTDVTLGDINWSSTDNDVLTVDDNGNITAISKGKAEIIAEVGDISKSFEIEVLQPASKIILLSEGTTIDDFTIYKNSSKNITVSLDEGTTDTIKEVTFDVGNENSILVEYLGQNQLYIKGLKEGNSTVEIHVVAVDIESKTHTLTKTITVIVLENNIVKVNLDTYEKLINVNDTFKLNVTVELEDPNKPNTDNSKITWESSNPSVATVDADGNVTAVSGGTAKITATIAGIKSEPCVVTVRVPLESISISGENTVLKNKTIQLELIKNPTDTTDMLIDIQYTVDKDNIASIDKNGKLKGLSEGEVTVTVTGKVGNQEYRATKKVTVEEIHISSVNIPESLILARGKNEKITPIINPDNTTDDITDVVWTSSNTDVVTVDENGNIKALAIGTAQIKVTVAGIESNICEVTVNAPLESISLTGENTVLKNKTIQLELIKNPTDTTDMLTDIQYTVDNKNLASIDNNGNLKGLSEGEVTVTVTGKVGDKDYTATKKVTVEEIHITEVTLSEYNKELNINDSLQLEATYAPLDTTDDTTVTWTSSNPTVASVDAHGKVVAVGKGTAEITATIAGIKSQSCKIVIRIPLTDISLSGEKEILKGQKTKLEVLKTPNNATDEIVDVVWESSDETIATVNNGMVTGIKEGTVIITAAVSTNKGEEFTDTIQIEVKEIHISSINILGNNTIERGEKAQLIATINPENTTDDKTVTWTSSDDSVISVDKDGKITAHKVGTATITVETVNNKIASINVNVIASLKTITLNSSKNEILKNESIQLELIKNPTDTTDTLTDIQYTVDNKNIASIDNNGKLKGLSEGKVTVTVTGKVGDKDYSATKEIIVKEIHITEVTINKESINLIKGESEKLSASFAPSNTTDDTTITWTSSNPSIALVDANGNVTAISGGTANIIATIAGVKSKPCMVAVRVPMTGIALNGEKEVLKGKEITLDLISNPVDTTDKIVNESWLSSDETIATVKNGIVTGVKEGTVIITAKVTTDQNEQFTITKEVTVKEIKLQSLDVKVDNRIRLYDTAKALVVYNPENTTDDKSVTWTSSDETILTIDENGNMKALKPGKATITVTSDYDTSIYKEVDIEVYEVPMTSIAFDKDEIKLTVDDEYKSAVIILPEDTTDSKELIYSSEDEEIAKVDENGVITALKKGETVIIVSTKDGILTDSIKVKVINKVIKPVYHLNNKDINLSISNEELEGIYNDIPDEFKELHQDGGKLVVDVNASIISDNAIINRLNGLSSQLLNETKSNIGLWINIEVNVKITSFDGEVEKEIKLSKLSKPLNFEVEIPDELLNNDYEYGILYIKDNQAIINESNLSVNKDVISFKNDCLGSYAILYKELKTNDVIPPKEDNKVDTGDSSHIGFALAGTIISGAALLYCLKKRKLVSKGR